MVIVKRSGLLREGGYNVAPVSFIVEFILKILFHGLEKEKKNENVHLNNHIHVNKIQ